jgi:acetyl esterase/lipase
MRQAAYLAERGVVTACIEYRLSDEATFPAALHDAKSAVRWLRANADRFDIDPARIGASGGSAGGHLAALLGTTANVPEFEGHENLGLASDVRVVVAFNPALDLLEIAKLRAAQGRPEEEATKFLGVGHAESPSTWDNASPISHVGPNSAQFLLLHGTDDETVPYQNSVDMLERLEAEGIHAELFTAEGAEHAFFNSSPWYAPATQKMAEFFLATL